MQGVQRMGLSGRIKVGLSTGVIVLSLVVLLLHAGSVQAADLAGETFNGISTPANAWISGGSGGSVACLTAASVAASNSIPNCSASPTDANGSGVLRLTPALNTRSGFAIYNTPISASDGLNIEFKMYQWGGTGADGISFFLIDGSANPTQPGASGGSLGYASSGETPGLVGGYVGVGFDRFGNYSNNDVGGGGPGPVANSIGIRGSEASGYDYVTGHAASGSLAGTTRSNSMRRVKININTSNVMSVAVDYGSGYVTELSGIDLNDINGEDALPPTFKFGFAASTGGSNNNHEISGLTVKTNPPSVGVALSHSGNFVQGGTGQFTMSVGNDSSAEATSGVITATQTLPTGLTPTAANGTGWACDIAGQVVTCIRPGDGGNALNPGTSAPNITVDVAVASNAPTPLVATAAVDTPENDSLSAEDTDSVTILTGSYLDDDGVFNDIEAAAPNNGDGNDDGTDDSQQDNVTSLPNPVTGKYAVLQTDGCSATNSNVSLAAESANDTVDSNYTYPAGLMNFTINCAAPGGTATVTQYFFGDYNASEVVARKYNETTQTYQTIPGATITDVTIGGEHAIKIVYAITDGGDLDQDGVVNGTIVDPSGPALLVPASAAPVTGSSNTTAGTPNTGAGTPGHSNLLVKVIFLSAAVGLTGTGLVLRQRNLKS